MAQGRQGPQSGATARGQRVGRGMAIRRRLIHRVLAVAFVSTTLASLAAYVLLLNGAVTLSASVLKPMFRGHFPQVHSQCEVSPQQFMVEGPNGFQLHAYALETGVSANPKAPPLDPTLFGRIQAGEAVASRLFWFEQEGGAAIVRTGLPGVCALFQVRWPFSPWRRSSLLSGFALGHGLLLGVAVLFTLTFGVTPLLQRIRQLASRAAWVGDTAKYATTPAPANDELGVIVAALDTAHARIVSAELSRQRQQQILLDHLADLSHDVMAPLGALQLILEALRTDGSTHPPEQQEYLLDASEEVEYLGALITNLSLAVQLREGLPPFDPSERVSVGGCVERVCLRMRFMARTRSMVLEGAWPDEPILGCCSALVLERVISNLVMNAITHGEEGGKVAVFVHPFEADRFQLVILDDGPGVPPAEMPRLTERRFRGEQGRSAMGSGLGLAIVGEICARAGWELSFSSESPRGLRITLIGRAEHPRIKIQL